MPEEEMMLAAELLVELDHQIVKTIFVQGVRAGKEVVIDSVIVARGVDIRSGEVAQCVFCDWIDAIVGDEIAGKRIARPDAIDIASAARIVYRDETPLAIDILGKIAAQKFLGRHGKSLRAGRSLPVALVIEHEETLVAAVVNFGNQDGAFHLPAELIEIVSVLGKPLRVVLE